MYNVHQNRRISVTDIVNGSIHYSLRQQKKTLNVSMARAYQYMRTALPHKILVMQKKFHKFFKFLLKVKVNVDLYSALS